MFSTTMSLTHPIFLFTKMFWTFLAFLLLPGHMVESASVGNVDWNEIAKSELNIAMNLKQNTGVAKNVIFFIGDGMGIPTVTASRILKGQRKGRPGEEDSLVFDNFPYVALSKTYNVDAQVADSAASATAMLTGVKVKFYTVGVDQQVAYRECDKVKGNEIDNILNWSHEAGKWTGVVTTTRVTHATPATTYAHSADRFWENDAHIPEADQSTCPDIASQLITHGNHINVLMGGGRRNFLPTTEKDPEYYNSPGHRRDGRNIINEWIKNKKEAEVSYNYVWNKTALNGVDVDNTEYLLGLFEPSHMHFEADRHKDFAGEPSLLEMVEKAIKILRRNKNGFFLLVEGGRIDHAHHKNLGKKALDETLMLDSAIEKAMQLTDQEDTLIVVTADHSHTMTIGGYPARGNPIAGVQHNQKYQPPLDGMPITTLMYANGPAAGRRNLTGVNTDTMHYRQESLVPMDLETHGGEDVSVYARGPWAHLFHGVHEQNYIAHVMAYASCVGSDKSLCSNRHSKNGDYKSLDVDIPSKATFLSMSFTLVISSLIHFILSVHK